MQSKFILRNTIPITFGGIELKDSLNKDYFVGYDDVTIDKEIYLNCKNKDDYDKLGEKLEKAYLENVNYD